MLPQLLQVMRLWVLQGLQLAPVTLQEPYCLPALLLQLQLLPPLLLYVMQLWVLQGLQVPWVQGGQPDCLLVLMLLLRRRRSLLL